MEKGHKVSLAILGLIILVLSFEIVRDTFTKDGDFLGYVLVGNLVMDGEYIYSSPLINTWPPLFSIISVPIAFIDNFNKYLVRFIWLVLSVFAMFHVVKYTTRMTVNRKLTLLQLGLSGKTSENTINVSHWVVLVPVLITFRYLLDNLANVQINVFMLLFALSSIYFFSKGRDVLAALVLAFAISIKVYPVFIYLYFVVKREYKIVLLTTLFCAVFSSVPFFVFGYEQTIEYYTFWYKQNVAPFASVGHKNQSYFSMMRSLLTHESPGLNQPLNQEIYLNVLNLSLEQVKMVSYAIIALIGSVVVFLFRKKITDRSDLRSFLEYALILTIIPILSPLAWKAYFIFLFPGYFVSYLFLFQFENTLRKSLNNYLKISFYVSIALTVLSSEMFVGEYVSDLLEAFSCITIGNILVAINILIFYVNFAKFDRSAILNKTTSF